MWTYCNDLMVPNSFFFNKVPHRFPWSLWFGLNVSQFRWMISGWSYSFWFGIFGNIFQFILLPTMKGHNLLWDVFGLLQLFCVTHMAHFSTFLQNLLHSFFILLINRHIVNDYQKVVIYGFLWFLILIC
jgi:hypothetical protein